ncbi:SDR family NAD(P)-dependent oxidoreductase [Paenibacillus sp. NPDC057934]|uniref:SDR family NAD(P)-dependent oxidoreductase n=1 Tax=Paenibacillus sp. NPDC057934 TaxID=3346282 RepID=UPI0036DCF96B
MKKTMMLEPGWSEQPVKVRGEGAYYGSRIVMLCEPAEDLYESLSGMEKSIRFIRLYSEAQGIAERYKAYVLQAMEEIRTLLESKLEGAVLIQIVSENRGEGQLFSGLEGLLRTARLENPKLVGQLVEVDSWGEAAELNQVLADNGKYHGEDVWVRYAEGKRQVAVWSEAKEVKNPEMPWREEGVYLITGGAGGLGMILAREIAEQARNVVLILTGRAAVSREVERKLEELQSAGARAVYEQVDVRQRSAVDGMMKRIWETYGTLNGIIHSAGVIRDSFLLKKRREEAAEVLGPKVDGLVNLDEASAGMALDFFILFSSVAGAIGNLGQGDYAAANAFMDRYALYRNERVSVGHRQGHTLSINWPLWKEGGMRVDSETEMRMLEQTGLEVMGKENGLFAFNQALAWKKGRFCVLHGDVTKLLKQYMKKGSHDLPDHGEHKGPVPQVNLQLLRSKTLVKLKALFGEAVKIGVNNIDALEPLESYGLDSILIMMLNQKIEMIFGECSKTIWYEYLTLEELTGHFVAHYPDRCMTWTRLNETLPSDREGNESVKEQLKIEVPVISPIKRKKRKSAHSFEGYKATEPIAIIGMSGRYPQADNLREYWANLEKGKDCIEQIPQDRWPIESFYDPDRKEAFAKGKSYSKWGGFLEGFADFDPLFFAISPRDAMNMDPQERIFVQSCWEALEDSGYTRERLEGCYKGKVGVYAGITKTGYGLYGSEVWEQGEGLYPHTSFSSVANRVSYLLNLKGPSMPVDTMCSSSLTAVHIACEHLRHGECEAAIVGGVNLYLHPTNFVELSGAQMLSADGRCKSFGKDADGFVPGEGVGVIILKPLSQAIVDGDQIYAQIRGTSVNHGGKTNGYTVPSPTAQTELIRQAIRKSGISSRVISYIEAHGTGTELGDPIEITGLTQAFEEDTNDRGFCAIGSAKSNIGHLEAAAGIAGLTKIVLQMKNQKLVPSLHAKEPNPNIAFAKTPFTVQQELRDWKRPVVEINGFKEEFPRTAGISSFGAGGANAHVVVEEYIPKEARRPNVRVSPEHPAMIVLSAKNEERLTELVRQWVDALEERRYTDELLPNIAYTLQTGREAMDERLGLSAASIGELGAKLSDWLRDPSGAQEIYRGQVRRNKEVLSAIVADEDMQEVMEKWIRKEKYDKLLDLWVKGMSVNWDKLYGEHPPHRISLPTYPFAKERYWVPAGGAASGRERLHPSPSVRLHPLLHENISDFTEQKYSSTWTGEEFFLTDHRVQGRKVLPGVAYLEMARAASENATGPTGRIGDGQAVRIKNVVWINPVVVGEEPERVQIGLYPEENGEIGFEVYQEEQETGEAAVYSQGRVAWFEASGMPQLDVTGKQKDCDGRVITADECYEAFEKMGISYGAAHRGIERIYVGEGQVLAKLLLPGGVADTLEQYVLHPSLLDSALQACLGMVIGDGLGNKPLLPFALGQIEVYAPCTAAMWAWVRHSAGGEADGKVQRLDIDLCDESGQVCIQMREFTSRVLEVGNGREASVVQTMMFEPSWSEQPVKVKGEGAHYGSRIVMLCEPAEDLYESLSGMEKSIRFIRLYSEAQGIAERYKAYVLQAMEEIRTLLESKLEGAVLIQIVSENRGEGQLFSGLEGLLRTARLENPKLVGQLVEVDSWGEAAELNQVLADNGKYHGEDVWVRYAEGKRQVVVWSEAKEVKNPEMPWREEGVYLITGGAGGLGMILAREIAEQARNVVLILTGRAAVSREVERKLEELQSAGARAVYEQVDVRQRSAVDGMMKRIWETYGTLNGIIHSAGVIRDSFLLKKRREEAAEVLGPKVDGLVNLDEASAGMALDFFILFSSVAGAIGNLGQGDYAAANAFMDRYALYRNERVSVGHRQGHTLSINWPLWKEGGMRVDSETEMRIERSSGMVSLSTEAGLRLFYVTAASRNAQVMVSQGHGTVMKERLLGKPRTTIPAVPKVSEEKGEAYLLSEKVQEVLAQMVSGIQKMKAMDVEMDFELSDYGFDSITLTKFANQLNQAFHLELAPTLFFEFSTLRELSVYLIREFGESLAHILNISANPEEKAAPLASTALEEPLPQRTLSRRQQTRFISFPAVTKEKRDPSFYEPIAIIGMSGKFPMSDDLDLLWKHLLEGKDCISEIPDDRWDWKAYYGDPALDENKSNIKWGGFMDGVDEFDPIFFGISPREAEYMDPQQRLLMTYAWKAIEDAGYAAENLSGTKVGMFIGTGSSGYNELITQAKAVTEGYSSTGKVPSVGPNRMSYFLNIHGPSEPVETACSSSLVAIHRAVNAIRNGECVSAIAGGVNTLVTPEEYISFSKAGMLSEDGKCKTFSAKANGYVRGEGVGMIFLKPLCDAERDGDHIYGVIKGTDQNHGGRSNSLTAPNPRAQAELIKTAWTKAGIDVRTAGYIEAHGTGTQLGDPIEVNGLKMAFKDLTGSVKDPWKPQAYCALGSIKTNIGHLELAAGIAGFIKILLQMKHKTLVKNLHLDEINPYIDLKDSPFYLVTETQEWKPLRNAEGRELPRRAGVSSFGFGGANAHVVVEEYIPKEARRPNARVSPEHPAMIVLSAKNEERLTELVRQWVGALEERRYTDEQLPDIAYTLQTGREAMDERLGLSAASIGELGAKLSDWLRDPSGAQEIYRGQVRRNKEVLSAIVADEDMQEVMEKWIRKEKYDKLLDLWVKGVSVNWDKLYGEHPPHRISLPTYPFAKERYWVPAGGAASGRERLHPSPSVRLHPLLHENISDFTEQKYSSTWTGEEFFLTDHRVQGRKVLPGVAYLEMARAASENVTGPTGRIGDGQAVRIKNVVWINPVVVGEEPERVQIGLYPEENGEIGFEVYQEEQETGEAAVYSQGRVAWFEASGMPQLDVTAKQKDCDGRVITADECYEAFEKMGISYGAAHRGIERIYVGEGQVLAKLLLPGGVADTLEQYVLHPSLLDSALQACLGMVIGDGLGNKPLLPFALEQIEVYAPCTAAMWAWIRHSAEVQDDIGLLEFDVDLCDDKGVLCARMRKFATRALTREESLLSARQQVTELDEEAENPVIESVKLAPVWEPVEVDPQVESQLMESVNVLVVIDYSERLRKQLLEQYPGAIFLTIGASSTIEEIMLQLKACGPIEHILWVAPKSSDHSSWLNARLIEDQESGVLQIFRLVKLLLRSGYGNQSLQWTIVTERAQAIYKNDMTDPTHASVHGFMGSLAKEYPNWTIRVLDVDDLETCLVASLFAVPANVEGNLVVLRDGQWYRQEFIPMKITIPEKTAYKQNGVYVVIGGAGGIGEVWSEYMIHHYQAKMIWIGRQAMGASIHSKINRLAEFGPAPVYIQADASDLEDLTRAYQEIKSQVSRIDGVIHSAIVLEDGSLANMEERQFRGALTAKVDVSVCMARVFQNEPLDFVMFFSSFNAFTKSPGQSNYAAGCTFKDAFAHRLAQEWHCMVKIMNWGYWGNVGVVASERYRKLMEKNGIYSIEPVQAMAVLEFLLAGPIDQIGLIHTSNPLEIQRVNSSEEITVSLK